MNVHGSLIQISGKTVVIVYYIFSDLGRADICRSVIDKREYPLSWSEGYEQMLLLYTRLFGSVRSPSLIHREGEYISRQ